MKKFLRIVLILAGLYLLLLIPLPQNEHELQKPSQTPFVWGQDTLWESLETNFMSAKAMPSVTLDSIVQHLTIEADSIKDAEYKIRCKLNIIKVEEIKDNNDFMYLFNELINKK